MSRITQGVHFFNVFISRQSLQNCHIWYSGECRRRNFCVLGPPNVAVTVTGTTSVQFRGMCHASPEHLVKMVQYRSHLSPGKETLPAAARSLHTHAADRRLEPVKRGALGPGDATRARCAPCRGSAAEVQVALGAHPESCIAG